MKIAEILARGPSYSFEFFPPRTPAAELALTAALEELEPLGPSYVSVTYGAGGSTREKTHDIVTGILRDTSMTPMAHLTCVGHTRAELEEIVTRYGEAGIENILALGGDPPPDLELPPSELHHAVELVQLIRGIGDFSIGVAAHPEPHPRSPDRESDRRHTAEKLAQADFAITQFFFDADHYFDLVASLHEHGVDKPVIPGIMPATTIGSIKRMTQLQGSRVPALARRQARSRCRRSRRGVRGRCRGGDEARPRAARRWRAGSALLHAEPLDRDPPDLRRPRPRQPLSGTSLS